VVNSTYYLGYAMEEQAEVWYRGHRLEEVRSDILRVAEIYNRLWAVKDVEDYIKLLQDIEDLNTLVPSGQPGLDCELL
jgi:hypothetical protein